MADYQLGPDRGRVLLKTGRAGLAARAGHDLTIEVTRWSGEASSEAVAASFDLGSLAVRDGTGGAKPLTGKDRQDIEATARRILGTGSAVFASTAVVPPDVIEGTLTLRGRSRPVRLQVDSPAPHRYRGSATVRQTDFGITPYSGFFGALKLRDEVAVEFEIDLT